MTKRLASKFKTGKKPPGVPLGPVTLDWTWDQAQAAQEAFEPEDPAGPFFQLNALHQIEALRAQFEGGDVHALMRAIRWVANHDLVMPGWVARGYIARFDQVNLFRAASWDDVLGSPLPKGKQLHAARDALIRPSQVKQAVKRLIDDALATGESKPIGDALFEEVGHELGISGAAAKRFYYIKRKAG